MTASRVTKSQKKQRLEWAMKKIDQGVGFSELASLVAETWGCSRRNARRVVTEAHQEWMDLAFGDDNVDQRDLLFQCIALPGAHGAEGGGGRQLGLRDRGRRADEQDAEPGR